MARHLINEYFRPAQEGAPLVWQPFPDNPEAQITGGYSIKIIEHVRSA